MGESIWSCAPADLDACSGYKVAASALYGSAAVRRDAVLDALRTTVKATRLRHYEACIAKRSSSVRVLVENLGEPHIAERLAQICDTFGVHHVYVVESRRRLSFPYDNLASLRARNVNGAEKFIRFHFFDTAAGALQHLLHDEGRGHSTALIRVECDSEKRSPAAISIDAVDWHALTLGTRRICFLLGDPLASGLSPRLCHAAHLSCFVPSLAVTPQFDERFGLLESLAITLAHLCEIHAMVGDLAVREPDEAASLYESCLLRSSKSAPKMMAKLREQPPASNTKAALERLSYY
ncbi:hypothetical protein FVE85_4253 [Porphyridium purpureum]|uniref:Uncharacterized protein n=1 Tax=Porphyridium purpureum TaxID=35688 RepID=A0A5J4YSM6_PORPP|nr:hypothetical protein FVE85_4253 [Porphyridium purpureum]|eukprot:POR1537..scf229_5